MDFVAILNQLHQVNALDASLYGVACGLGLFLRFARAMWFHFSDAQTGAACIGLGAIGACLELTIRVEGVAPHPPQFIALQAIMLSVGVAVVEMALRKAADSNIPLLNKLPSDNQWSENPKIDPANPASKEGKP